MVLLSPTAVADDDQPAEETEALAPRPAPNPPAGTVSFALYFSGYLLATGMQRAFADLIARHKTLRTVRPPTESAASRVVLPPQAAPLPRLVPDLTPEDELSAATAEFCANGGACSQNPVRARLFRVLDGNEVPEHKLVVVLRPPADLLPPPVLARDLMTAYFARRRNQAPSWDSPARELRMYELRQVELLPSVTV